MSFRDELERKSIEWVQSGVISAGQRERILAGEPVRAGAAPRLIAIFSLLGAALVVLGLILVISQNWDDIPKLVKLAGGVTFMVAVYAVGYWLRFGPPSMTRTGEGVLLVGSGALLGNLALISQQYNIEFNPSPLFLPVLLAAIALAYNLRSRGYIVVAAALAVAWLTFESQRDGSLIETRGTLALLLVGGLGVWFFVAAELNRRVGWATFAEPLRIAGGLTVFAVVYWLGFYRHYPVDENLDPLPAVALVVLPLVAAVAAFLVIAAGTERRFGWPGITAESRRPLLATAATLTAFLGWSLAVGLNPREIAEDGFILYTVGFWVLALAMTADLVWLGLALRREWWMNVALIYVGVFTITRYFDLFSDYGQTGLLFAGAGLLLLALAFILERSRRALRDEMAENAA